MPQFALAGHRTASNAKIEYEAFEKGLELIDTHSRGLFLL